MNSHNSIQQELQELGSRLPHDKQPVFTVPHDYFEQFAASMLQKIKSPHRADAAAGDADALSPVLDAIPRQMPYHVPPGYFTQLPAGLPVLVANDWLPAVLSTSLRETPYAVPQGYFDGLAAQAIAHATAQKAKVVPLRARFMRVAAAAVLAGALAAGGIFYLKGPKGVEPDLKDVSKSDIENFLKTVDTGSGSRELAQKGGKGEVQKMLHDVSTPELDAFLSDVPAEPNSLNIN